MLKVVFAAGLKKMLLHGAVDVVDGVADVGVVVQEDERFPLKTYTEQILQLILDVLGTIGVFTQVLDGLYE